MRGKRVTGRSWLFATMIAGLIAAMSITQVTGTLPWTGFDESMPLGQTAGDARETTAAIAVDPRNPTALVNVRSSEPSCVDPAVDYETEGGEVIQNVYETLVWYDRESASHLIPMLATEVPTIENGGISDDGMNYTFHIREDVTFHDGTGLSAEDVAYSIQRVLRIHDDSGPSWMIEQVTTNYLSSYIGLSLQTYIDDCTPPQWILDAIGETDPAYVLTEDDNQAVAEAAVTIVDDMTVNFRLTKPFPAFLKICAYTVMSIVSMDYVEDNGGIQNGATNYIMAETECGTGPYELLEWEFGTKVRLGRFPEYWGPSPALEYVYIIQAADDETRMIMLENGDADTAEVSITNEPRFDGDPDFEIFKGDPTFYMTFAGFNMAIDTVAAADFGSEVPEDFFADREIRLAFAHLVDYDTFIENVLKGNAIQPNGPIPKGMFGYDETIPTYEYSLETAKTHLQAAINPDTGNSYWEDGFKIALFYNSGNTYRETACNYLKAALDELTDMASGDTDAVFSAVVNTLDWPTYVNLRDATPSPFPMYYLGWAPDYADPDDYVTPFLDSVYGTFTHSTGYVNASIDELARAAAVELDDDVRAEMYSELGMLVYEDAPYLWLWQDNNFHIQRSWVEGYYFNPMHSGLYYASLSKLLGEPPHAEFTINPPTGDTSTLFEMNASSSSDEEDPTIFLQYRWDWESDGVWDTDWSSQLNATHQYTVAGSYTVVLEVKDSTEQTDTASQTLVVTDLAIPEFTTLIIPVAAVLAAFVAVAHRRK